MGLIYTNPQKFNSGIHLDGATPLDDRLQINDISNIYISNTTVGIAGCAIYGIAYDGMVISVVDPNHDHSKDVVLIQLKDATPYKYGSPGEVNENNFTEYWTVSASGNVSFDTSVIDASINRLESTTSTLNINYTNLNGKVNTLDSSVNILDSDINNIQTDITSIKQKNISQDSSLNTLDSSIRDLYNKPDVQSSPVYQKDGQSGYVLGDTNDAQGENAFAEGENTTAFGEASHAEGYQTTASGDYGSHAEGYQTTASGDYGSHAEGENTTASGEASHAEGVQTTASGVASHAEGEETIASGDYSHAEGYSTNTSGNYGSHAEGYSTNASGNYGSHAEGYRTIASGESSHAEGGSQQIMILVKKNYIAGDYQIFVESDVPKWVLLSYNNEYTVVEYSEYDSEQQAYLLDLQTSFSFDINANMRIAMYKTASGQYSHKEGYNTHASGDYGSHAEGNETTASGQSSHAEGDSTTASGTLSHAEGQYTTASGTLSHAEGNWSIASGNNAHAEGNTTIAFGNCSHVEGEMIAAAGRGSHAEGGESYSFEYEFTLTKDYQGGSNYIYVEYDSIFGETSDGELKVLLKYNNVYVLTTSYYYDKDEHSYVLNTDGYLSENNISTGTEINYIAFGAFGEYSHAEGYSTASGNYSHSEGQYTTASGEQSHAEGQYTTASGEQSHAEGISTTAFGQASHAEGEGSIALGDYSHAEAEALALGVYSHAEGTCDSRDKLILTQAYRQGDTTLYVDRNDVSIGTPINYDNEYRVVEDSGEGYIELNEGFSFDIQISGKVYIYSGAGGKYSHSEGESCTAAGDYSHAEGTSATALGYAAHAEGGATTASDDFSHAEGENTTASGEASHAEGVQTTASGVASHAEGMGSMAFGENSHAEGADTQTNNEAEHASGIYNKSTENVTQFSVGVGTDDNNRKNAFEIAIDGSVYINDIGGYNGTNVTSAKNIQNVVKTINSSINTLDASVRDLYINGSSSGGSGNSPIYQKYGQSGYVLSDTNNAFGEYAFAQGQYTNASGDYSHAEGYETRTGGDYSHADGYYTYTSNVGEHASGMYNYSTEDLTQFSVGIGTDNFYDRKNALEITNDGKVFIYNIGNYNGTNVYDASSLQDIISGGGGGSSSGGYISYTEYKGYILGDSGNTAEGQDSFAEGYHTSAEGDYSHTEGYYTTATGDSAHAEGYYTSASGNYSHTEGKYTQTTNEAEHASGKYNKSTENVTQFSVGIGTNNNRKNAFEITVDGSIYVKGMGDYDGTNARNATPLQDIISGGSGGSSSGGYISYIESQGYILGDSGNTAEGQDSFAEGYQTTASGNYSHTEGEYTQTTNEAEHASGMYNKSTEDLTQFSVGIGTNNNRKNAFEITIDGKIFIFGMGDYDGTNANSATALQDITFGGSGDGGYITYNEDEGYAVGSNTATGEDSFAVGYDTIASGDSAHAEGSATTASGDSAHAEGSGTNATGQSSHTEGTDTTASHWCAHAEGYQTTASGEFSHAEGRNTITTGYVTHAEGIDTSALGQYSHAEGNSTIANLNSHTEGYQTQAMNYSHAEGYQTFAFTKSHSEGQNTFAIKTSHAEGNGTVALYNQSHAEGYGRFSGINVIEITNISGEYGEQKTITTDTALKVGDLIIQYIDPQNQEYNYNNSIQQYDFDEECYEVEELLNQSGTIAKLSPMSKYSPPKIGKCYKFTPSDGGAFANNAHSEGYQTVAIGESSHSEGDNTTASGQSSHAEGSVSKASGRYAHSEGQNTTASGDRGAHAEGHYTTADGEYGAHAEGYYTTASGESSHAEGKNTQTTNEAEHACGKYNLSTLNQTLFSIGNGTSPTTRKNTIEVDKNGNVYIQGIGGYNGKNASDSSSLQEIIIFLMSQHS